MQSWMHFKRFSEIKNLYSNRGREKEKYKRRKIKREKDRKCVRERETNERQRERSRKRQFFFILLSMGIQCKFLKSYFLSYCLISFFLRYFTLSPKLDLSDNAVLCKIG